MNGAAYKYYAAFFCVCCNVLGTNWAAANKVLLRVGTAETNVPKSVMFIHFSGFALTMTNIG